MPWPPPFCESEVRAAVAESIRWSSALRALGYEPKGHNIRTLQRWVKRWGISTQHFDDDHRLENLRIVCALRGVPQPGIRKADRPSYEQLLEDVRTMSFLAVGRKYGVSDKAVRKWIRWYERGKDADGEADLG